MIVCRITVQGNVDHSCCFLSCGYCMAVWYACVCICVFCFVCIITYCTCNRAHATRERKNLVKFHTTY